MGTQAPSGRGSVTGRATGLLVGGLLLALLLAAVVSQYASDSPDGLDRVVTDSGLADGDTTHRLDGSPLSAYEAEGIGNDSLGAGVAGAVGVILTFGVGTALAVGLRRRGGHRAAPPGRDGNDSDAPGGAT